MIFKLRQRQFKVVPCDLEIRSNEGTTYTQTLYTSILVPILLFISINHVGFLYRQEQSSLQFYNIHLLSNSLLLYKKRDSRANCYTYDFEIPHRPLLKKKWKVILL